MPKPTKKTITMKAKQAVAFGKRAAKGRDGGKGYRINAAMCYNLCMQIIGDDARFDGSARDLIMRAFELRGAEL